MGSIVIRAIRVSWILKIRVIRAIRVPSIEKIRAIRV
jgi:hypothetical protein